jgi:hypothetical protein
VLYLSLDDRRTHRIQEVTAGHKKIHFEYRRNLADTIGHERTRHDAGSGP